ncbi:cell wall-active antibiotics response protein [candidate division KSB1 bacterium]|nr:cell wall-active antibiotics response protein [candidate division KSB1 bacterium]
MERHSKSGTLIWGGLLILLGLFLMIQDIHFRQIMDFLFEYWPLILVAVGIWFIYAGMKRSDKTDDYGQDVQAMKPDANGRVLQSTTFGDLRLVLEGSTFQSGEMKNVFGDIKIDALRLRLPEGEHQLSLQTTLGDIRVELPADMPVKVAASVTLGDIRVFEKKQEGFSQQLSFQTPNYDSAVAKLFIYCQVVLGDVKIV